MHLHEPSGAVPSVDAALLRSWDVGIRHRHAENGLVAWDLDLKPEFRAPPHLHEIPFFCILLEGWMENDYRHRQIAFHPSLNVFHPAGTVHTGFAGARGARLVTIEADPTWERRIADLAPLPDRPVEVPFEDGVWLARRLVRELQSPDASTPLVLEGLTLELLAAACRAPAAERTAPPWLRRVLEQIHDRFAEPISLAELAEDVDVHPARVSIELRRHTGCTFGDYLRRLRVGYVEEHLRDPELPLAELALAAGFADQAHCTRVFKATTGWTPGRYRRALDRGRPAGVQGRRETFKTPAAFCR
ncbi:MAG: helix-turn-helix domain-containing protein [Thermoanaerobaculia bacterium]